MSNIQTTPVPVPVPAPTAEEIPPPRVNWLRRVLAAFLFVVGLFAFTYALAWFNSYSLSTEFYQDAEAAYAEGGYLDSLVGYEEIDPETNLRVERGGYFQAIRVWNHGSANPKPPIYSASLERIQEIIGQRLDIQSAETFIQRYTGRGHAYFADIYLRLGELYEQDGDERSAAEIYRDVIDLFPARADLIERANQRLAALGEE